MGDNDEHKDFNHEARALFMQYSSEDGQLYEADFIRVPLVKITGHSSYH